METKISFVVPTHNRVEWLAECIESLRNQIMQEIQIIIVDDCSTDTTKQLVNYFLANDSRIIYVKNDTNLKAGLSRNVGNKFAEADIICVCDDDDFYPKDRAEVTYKYFQENPDIDIMNGSYYRADYSGRIIKEFKSEPFNVQDFKDGKGVYFCHPSCAYRKKDILELPYKTENDKETDDYQLVRDWVNAGKKFGNTDKFLCFHRVLPGSMMYHMRGESLE